MTEYASKNALIKVELCVGKITEIKCHCNSEDNSWMSPLPSACSAHQNAQFSLFLFSVLPIVSSMSKNSIICCSLGVAYWSEPVEEEDLALFEFSLLVSFVN